MDPTECGCFLLFFPTQTLVFLSIVPLGYSEWRNPSVKNYKLQEGPFRTPHAGGDQHFQRNRKSFQIRPFTHAGLYSNDHAVFSLIEPYCNSKAFYIIPSVVPLTSQYDLN